MSDQQYSTVVSDAGAAKIVAAVASGVPLSVAVAAVGDGGGGQYSPTTEQTGLRNELWRGPIVSADVDPTEPKMLNVRFVVPPEAGGFTVREAAVFDKDGDMLAACNLPDTKKEAYGSGTTGKLTIIMRIAVADTGALAFEVRPDFDGVTLGQLSAALAQHDGSGGAHPDIRATLAQMNDRLQALEFGLRALSEQMDLNFAGTSMQWGFAADEIGQWAGYDGGPLEGIWDMQSGRLYMRGVTA